MDDFEYIFDDDGNKTMARSKNSNEKAYVRFVNATQHSLEIIWLNYEGKRVFYRTLNSGEHYDVDTFATHPWIFKHSQSNERFSILNRTIFTALPEFRFNNKTKQRERIRRVYNITIQMKHLRQLALTVIAKLITIDKVELLEIPHTLHAELVDLVRFYGNI